MAKLDTYPGRPSYPGEGLAGDETACYHCGADLPEDPQENTPAWEGYCSAACQRGEPTPCIRPMFELLKTELERDTLEGWQAAVYKGTSCGAWLKLADHQSVQIGSIVEGADECTTTHLLRWPFSAEQFWGVLTAIEAEADAIWNQTHGCERCAELHGFVNEAGEPVEGADGATPVHAECDTCDGDGVAI